MILSCLRRALAAIRRLLLILVVAPPVAAGGPAPDAAEISRLVRQLGAEKLEERDEELFEQLQQRMATAEAQQLYKQRKQTVVLSFADSKQHRKFRQFNGRGLERAEIEVGLLVLVHNGLIVQQARLATPPVEEPAPA